MTTTYRQYRSEKDAFFRKHKHDFQTYTSPLNEYNVYYKDYVFADGAHWYERMGPTFETASASVEVNGITVEIKQDIKLFETEYFSSDDANSKKYYEKW